MFSTIPNPVNVVIGVIGSAASFGLDHLSTIAAIVASIATAVYMCGCIHEKYLKIWKGRRMESQAPFPRTKDEKK